MSARPPLHNLCSCAVADCACPPLSRSVRAFAGEFLGTQLPLHGLVCNAGVGLPRQSHTEDGFETTVG